VALASFRPSSVSPPLTTDRCQPHDFKIPRATAWRADSRLALLARLGYVGVLALATLTPFQLDPDLGAAVGRLARTVHPSYTPGEVVGVVRNVGLFAGWGAPWTVTAPYGSSASRSSPNPDRTSAECRVDAIQALMPLRTSSVMDVLANTAGAVAGSATVVGAVTVLQAR